MKVIIILMIMALSSNAIAHESEGEQLDKLGSYVLSGPISPLFDFENDMQRKSVSHARWNAIGFTFVPIFLGSVIYPSGSDEDGSEFREIAGSIMVLGGIVIGPSAGSIYADDWRRATYGMIIRSGGILVASAGVGALISGALGSDDSVAGLGVVLFAGGLAVTAGSMIYDIILSSQRSVEDYNRRHQGRAELSVLPWFEANSGRPGFTLNLRF
jgi:hypothetical protein